MSRQPSGNPIQRTSHWICLFAVRREWASRYWPGEKVRWLSRKVPLLLASIWKGQLDWKSFSVILMRALMPFAEAKAAVLEAFRDVGVYASP